MRCLVVACLLPLAALAAPPASAADDAGGRAMFRGTPALTGVYGARPVHAIAGVRFAFAAGGPIRSTAAVAGGVLYFGSSDGSFHALDASSGRERWRVATGGAITSSPAIAGGRVYFASRDGALRAVDAATGAPRWRFEFGRDLGADNYWDYYLSSPVVAGDVLFIGSGDGHVYALDAKSGRLRWRYAIGARVRATPAVDGGTVVAAAMNGRVYALAAKDGALRWTFATRGATNTFADQGNDTTSIAASPSIGGGIVTVGGRDGNLYALDVASGALRWQATHDGSSWILATAIDDGAVYVASGSAQIVAAADLRTGTERWRHATGGAVFSSLTIAGDTLYFADIDGNLEAVDKATGARRWRYPLPDRVFATPVVANGIVYCGADDGTMLALDDDPAAAVAIADVPTRVVYWEGKKSAQAFGWFANDVDAAILRYFVAAGYRQLDGDALAAFMTERIATLTRSVVVFADNRIPASVVEEPTARALIRRYLDAGGKVVLLGANPLAFRADPVTGVVDDIDFGPARAVFGVDYPELERVNGYYASRPTAAGRRSGLRGSWVGTGAIDPVAASTVLALDEFGMASVWIRAYGGPPGTGLLQLGLPRAAATDYARYRAVIEYGLY